MIEGNFHRFLVFCFIQREKAQSMSAIKKSRSSWSKKSVSWLKYTFNISASKWRKMHVCVRKFSKLKSTSKKQPASGGNSSTQIESGSDEVAIEPVWFNDEELMLLKATEGPSAFGKLLGAKKFGSQKKRTNESTTGTKDYEEIW